MQIAIKTRFINLIMLFGFCYAAALSISACQPKSERSILIDYAVEFAFDHGIPVTSIEVTEIYNSDGSRQVVIRGDSQERTLACSINHGGCFNSANGGE